MQSLKTRRNDPCTCQSGRKYKHCCFGRGDGSSALAGSARQRSAPADSGTTEQALRAQAATLLLQDALVAHQAGDFEAATALYIEMLKHEPAHPDALHLLGLIDFQHGRHAAALARIEAAIGRSRHDPRYFYNLGTVLMALKRPRDAVAQFRIAIGMDPGNGPAHGNLGAALCELGERDAAIDSFRTVLALTPDDPDTWANLCVTYVENEQPAEAARCLERALALDPHSAKALNNIGFALQKSGDFARATAYFAQAIELDPRNDKALINLGSVLMTHPLLDDPDLAVTCFREALAIDPANSVNHSSLLIAMQYAARCSPAELFACHRDFAHKFEAPLAAAIAPHRNARDPARRLKIGYVSADLYNHAVATFLDPILRGHDRAHFEVSCYYNNDKQDATTERLRAQVDRWVPCKWMTDAALAERIAADGIDILIDVSGHSASNRLLVFARKPAPLQASWIGYPGTTGLDAMDYYLADRHWLPEGVCDDQFSEKIVRLPVTGVTPYVNAPEVNVLPALQAGRITFGSFNQLHKFTAEVVGLWSRLLQAVPDSRLVIGAMPSLDRLEPLIALFAANGVARERLEFHTRKDMQTYLSLHHAVDLCLDTFPYSGGTTTVHALWMGVPTLTLAGHTAAGRQGCGLPHHLGLEPFVAENPDDFVVRGVAVVSDLPRLAETRRRLRPRMAASALCNPRAGTVGLEAALRTMWQRWCAGLPPASFEVPSDSLPQPDGTA